MSLRRLSVLFAVFALAVLGCPTDGGGPTPEAETETERDLPGQGVMTKETALKIFEYTELEDGGVRIDKFTNAGALSEYLAGNARLAAAVSDQPFKINRINGKPVTRIAEKAFSPNAAGVPDIGTVVLRIELPVTIVELGINLFDGVEVKIIVDIPASAVEKLKENYIKKHNLDAAAAANLELGDILGEILAGSSVDIQPVEDPAAPVDPSAAAQLAADINAIGFIDGTGSATVDGELALLNATLTVNGTVKAESGKVRMRSAASWGTINGSGTIQLKGKGRLLDVRRSDDVANKTLTFDGVTLVGVADNNGPLVQVNNGGTLVMKSGKITGNTYIGGNDWAGGSGVGVWEGGVFTMQGGEISGNTAKSNDWAGGGGVHIGENGTFTMQGGTISGNTASGKGSSGGGIELYKAAFTMTGGTISDNTAASENEYSGGGGVAIGEDSTFTMQGGTISGNTAESSDWSNGGGVDVENGVFTMEDGVISGNAVKGGRRNGGGGVQVGGDGAFIMKDGAISGNTAKSDDGSSGGGVRVENGAFTMKGGEISGNTAESGTVSGNTIESGSHSNGGGVDVWNGAFTMEGGVISGNTIKGGRDLSGGGVQIGENSTFTMVGGTIYGKPGSAGTDANLANNAEHNSALGEYDSTAATKWALGGTYTKGGVTQTGGSDIGSTDDTLIAIP